MQQLLNISGTPKKYLALIALFLSQSLLWAQDKKVDVSLNVNKGESSTWYAEPWVWVVGIAVFIIILVAILKGSGGKNN